MEHCNSAITPCEARLQLFKSEDEQDVDPTQYRILIGSLRYLCNTRLDLAFSVGIANRFIERPKVFHMAAVKRILRYVKGTLGCGILFPALVRAENVIYLVSPIPIDVVIKMIENQLMDTSLCLVGLQSLGV
ncbi:uncharacterized mitochondrial protein AtMg00810-like [Vicia villosa]|uniref:uncharacterized mitochondrial protein AtMg00810-like n=1 Tax=Vicia villosa TaxID=3911 RepID=UPI00273C20D8|nr:uncharacterized mitochondrial protein AtMg00810-like [Vicia villosa]